MKIRPETPFVPNDEVDQLKWLGVDAALKMLEYGLERDLLRAVVNHAMGS